MPLIPLEKNTPSKGELIYDQLHIYGTVADHAQRESGSAGAWDFPSQRLHPHALERLPDNPDRQAHGSAEEQVD